MAGASWTGEDVAQRIRETPERAASYTALMNAVGDEHDLRVCAPSLTFSHRMRLIVDELTVELEHVGGQHALDSIVVRLPEVGVLFLGDCYYPPPLHLRTAEAIPDWAMPNSLVDDAYGWYIEGHNLPQTLMDIRKSLADINAI